MAKILIAEDEPDIRNLITLTLRHAGHEVATADDGQAAYEQAREVAPALIILDVKMPRLNGYEACKRIKADPALKDVPVVFLTVRGADREVQEGFEAGAAEYLVKPFAPAELIQCVARLLAPPKAP